MKRLAFLFVAAFVVLCVNAQNVMTPELLWKLGRINAVGVTRDGDGVVYTVSTPDVEANKSQKKTYVISLKTGTAQEIADSNDYVKNDRISPNGKYMLRAEDVKMRSMLGKDVYPDLPKTTAQIY